LGCGFLEAVYQEALALEFSARSVPYQPEVELALFYEGRRLNTIYRPDFVCFGSVVVELKALTHLGPLEAAQIINYLKATDQDVGLLLSFGTKSLEYRRFASSEMKSAPSA